MRSEPTRLLAAVVLACSTLAPVARAATPVPDGQQFVVVNLDYNAGGGVELDDGGNMIVSWNLFFGGPAARGYTSDGTPTIFFNIEPYGGLLTLDPMDSAALANNDFAFVWEGSFEGLQARRYNILGMPLAAPIQVTAAGGAFQDLEPAIAGWAPSTDMVVVWASDNPATGDTDGFGIDAQGFNSAGTPLGPAFRVNADVAGDQGSPDIAVAADHGFLIVWQSDGSAGSDSDGLSIQGHRFTAAGQEGNLFQVNSFTTGDQERPAVALAADGQALVVWKGSSAAGDPDQSIQGRIVDVEGVPQGADFQINTTSAGNQRGPTVTHTGSGCFQVAWHSGSEVFTQAVSVDGTLLGPEIPVNAETDFGITRLDIASNALGSIVVWAEEDPVEFDPLWAQRYRPSLFTDGFESGDTSAWSATVP